MNFNPAPFQSWLINRKYSTSTVKNYLADVNKYLRSLDLNSSQKNFLSTEAISSYLSSLTDKKNYNRYLASLNKFCQFALDQKIISANPIKKILKSKVSNYQDHIQTTSKQISDQFNLYLKQQNKSNSTIKNYLVDINQFLLWASHES